MIEIVKQWICKHDWIEHCALPEGRVMLCKKCYKDYKVIDNWR